jgi:xanthosine utilization system XapX-like protein
MFGGMPAYQISVVYASNLLKYVDAYIFRLHLPRPADYFFLYMVGFFILLLVLGVDPWLSVVGAIAFAFSSYFIIILEAGHNSKAHAIGYMAPVLAFVIYTFRTKKYLLGGVLFSFFMALELNANHPQITYYLGLIILIYGISEFISSIREKQIPHFVKSVGVLVVGLLLALATSLGNYWTTMEYSPYTIRGASELSFDHHIKSAGLDRDYATQWSYGKAETATLLIPNANGGGSIPLGAYAKDEVGKVNSNYRQNVAQFGSYFGEQPFTSGPVYIGAIVVFLFVLGLFILKGSFRWVLLAATLLSIFLSWGHNMMWFTDLFFDYLPAYNKFRTVSMTLVIAQLTMALMAFLALNEVLKNPNVVKEKAMAFYISFGLTGGLALVFYLMPSTFFDFLSSRELNQLADLQIQQPKLAIRYEELFDEAANVRMAIFKSDALRSFALILFSALAVFLYGIKKIPKVALIGVMGLLVLIDLVPVDKRFLKDDDFKRQNFNTKPYAMSQANYEIMQDKELDYRVFNVTVSPFNDASTSYFHKSIGGYHGAKLRRYQDIIEHHLSKNNMEVINMLNTKYFIVKGPQGPISQRNPGALGPAWFVHYIQWVPSPDQEIIHLGNVLAVKTLELNDKVMIYGRPMEAQDTMLQTTDIVVENYKFDLSKYNLQQGINYVFGNDPTNLDSNFIDLSREPGGKRLAKKQFEAQLIFSFDPQKAAIVNKEFKNYLGDFDFTFDPTASIKLVHYQANYLKYETNANSEQLAVFSEIYYKDGWEAFIDGEKVDYARADYILRAMKIPAGKHVVEFRFEPSSYFVGKTVSLISSVLVLLLLIGVGYWTLKGKEE